MIYENGATENHARAQCCFFFSPFSEGKAHFPLIKANLPVRYVFFTFNASVSLLMLQSYCWPLESFFMLDIILIVDFSKYSLLYSVSCSKHTVYARRLLLMRRRLFSAA